MDNGKFLIWGLSVLSWYPHVLKESQKESHVLLGRPKSQHTRKERVVPSISTCHERCPIFDSGVDPVRYSNPPTLQTSNLPTLQPSNPPTLQPSNPPTLQNSNPPTLQTSNPPPKPSRSKPNKTRRRRGAEPPRALRGAGGPGQCCALARRRGDVRGAIGRQGWGG